MGLSLVYSSVDVLVLEKHKDADKHNTEYIIINSLSISQSLVYRFWRCTCVGEIEGYR